MFTQRLDLEFRHVLRRCPDLTDPEVRLLAFVASYSKGCLLSYEEICKLTNWSRAKLNRAIRSLEKKKLIEITYRAYKRTTIKIASPDRQSEFAKSSHMSRMTQGSYSTHESVIGHQRNQDMPPVIQSILEKELERKEETDSIDKETKMSPTDVRSLIAARFPNLKFEAK